MKNNIEYSGDAWPCENQDQANYHGKDKTFTNYEQRHLSKYIWPKDTGAYEYQDGNLKCGKGQKLRILTAEFGRPWNKPICWPKNYYDLDPPSAAWHEGTWLWTDGVAFSVGGHPVSSAFVNWDSVAGDEPDNGGTPSQIMIEPWL